MGREIEIHSGLEAICRIGEAMSETDWKRIQRAIIAVYGAKFTALDEQGRSYSIALDDNTGGLLLVRERMPAKKYDKHLKECADNRVISFEYIRRHNGNRTNEEIRLLEVH